MKKPVLVSLLCVLAVLALLVWGFRAQKVVSRPVEKQYVLLVESDTGSFLMQLRKGIQEAAALHNARVTVQNAHLPPLEMARQLADGGVSAAMLLLSQPEPMAEALSQAGIPAVVVTEALPQYLCVASDDFQAGAALMDRALALAEPSRILLITAEGDARAQSRAAGAQAQYQDQPVAVQHWLPGGPLPTGDQVVIATNSALTHLLAAAKLDGDFSKDCQVLGVDTGDHRVSDLESGLVSALLMDNPYAMGYTAMTQAMLLSQGAASPTTHRLAVPLIDISNMYLMENVKMVFPLLQ